MLRIDFCSKEVQNAIYDVSNSNYPDKFAFEKAISDYLLMQGDFEIGKGKYGSLINEMKCRVFEPIHYEELQELIIG